MRKKVLVILCIGLSIGIYGQQKGKRLPAEIRIPMEASYWEHEAGSVEFIDYKSVTAVRGVGGNGFKIFAKDLEFTDGTIEYDVELTGRGFPGINFRLSDDALNGEIFYIRYFGTPDPFLRTTLQYASIQDGVNMWDMTDEYQAAATLFEGGWNHVKLVISGRQMMVYVNDMENVALSVPYLEGENKAGRIALAGNVIYANLIVRPNATENLPSLAGYDHTANDPRYLRNWSVTGPKDLPFGRDVMLGVPVNPGVAIDSTLLDASTVWKPLRAERRALVNLTRLYGQTAQGERRLVWLKTNISTETSQERRIDMGFSEEVWVFINGQPLLTDKNYFGSPGMKEPVGRCTIENTSFKVPLKAGDNELLIGVANYFYGWGIIARLDTTNGLRF
mgnify:CR=1 FL=1|tara:strand:- start:4832 stop:6004 length:1173 start_codon:yes stop_codon:yes gene_type:complete